MKTPQPTLPGACGERALMRMTQHSAHSQVDFTKEAAHIGEFAQYIERTGVSGVATCPSSTAPSPPSGARAHLSTRHWLTFCAFQQIL